MPKISARRIPPSRDYFNGKNPNEVLSNAFDQAVADPSAWTTEQRKAITFSHYVIGPIAQIPGSARMTWVQNLVLGRPITGETILTLGQSGFIGVGGDGAPVFDAHFLDQLPLYRSFQYKAMPLYRNWRLDR